MNVSVRDLFFSYGKKQILKGIDLTLQPGTLTVLIGPNGAGKSTLLKILAGLLEPSAGEILLEDAPLREIPLRRRAQMIGVMPQTPPPVLDFTAEEFVMLGRFAKLPRLSTPKASDRDAVAAALETVGMTAFAQCRANALSGGEFERLRLAALLALQSEVLLADEPTAAQDPAHALTMLDQLKKRSQEGSTVIAVMHDLNLTARAAGRVILLANGRVLADGRPQEVMTEERLSAAYQVPVIRRDHDGGFYLEFEITSSSFSRPKK